MKEKRNKQSENAHTGQRKEEKKLTPKHIRKSKLMRIHSKNIFITVNLNDS